MPKRSLSSSSGSRYVKSRTRSAKRGGISARSVGLLSSRTRGVKKGRAQGARPASLSLEKRITNAIVNMKEPKYTLQSFTGQSVGQINANASGANTNNLNAMMPVQGDGVNQRDGLQIVGRYFKIGLSMWQMSNCYADTKVKFYLVRQIGTQPTFALSQLFRQNQALYDLNTVSVYDATSMRNQFFNENYEIVGSHEVVIRRVNGNTFGSCQENMYFPLDNQLIQFVDGTADPRNTTFTLVAVASYGNKNTTTAGTMLGVMENNQGSGLLYNYTIEFGYRDI